jgi:hypothetical protein
MKSKPIDNLSRKVTSESLNQSSQVESLLKAATVSRQQNCHILPNLNLVIPQNEVGGNKGVLSELNFGENLISDIDPARETIKGFDSLIPKLTLKRIKFTEEDPMNPLQFGFNKDLDAFDGLFNSINNQSIPAGPADTLSRFNSVGNDLNGLSVGLTGNRDFYFFNHPSPYSTAEMPPPSNFGNSNICEQKILNMPKKKKTFEFFETEKEGIIGFLKLDNLKNLCTDIFCKGEINALEYKLDPLEESIFNSILMRKFFKKLRKDQMSLSKADKVEQVNKIILSRSSKRPEEFYKFVLTRIIKSLKKRFKDDINIAGDYELAFYQYYFGQTSKDLDLSLDNFLYPLTGKACVKKAKEAKVKFSLNTGYYQRIFKSKLFLADMEVCIESMTEEYSSEIANKIELLLSKWDKELAEGKVDLKEFETKVTFYLEKNKRCKLPWTISEVNDGIQRFKILVESISNANL